MPTLSLVPANFDDDRAIAERRLPRTLFDYVDGGAGAERTMRSNTSDFEAIALRQTVLRDVSEIRTSIELFGETLAMPLALAPVGLGGMMARRAETQAKRAADAAGVPFCLSTVAICSIEEVATVSERPFWFQLYMLRDRGPVRELLQRARDAGVGTLVFTVDLSVAGARYRDVRNGMSGVPDRLGRLRGGLVSYLLHPRWLVDVALGGRPHTFGSLTEYVPSASTPADFKSWVDSQFDPTVTWSDIEWLRKQWPGNLIIKGVMCAEDARLAIRSGADGVVISNHGGRQLEGAPSSITALARVAEALEGATELLMDGGVRSGQDILRALALGAKAVLIGRPWVYAVAAGGWRGGARRLGAFRSELETAMALTGVTDSEAIGPDILEPV